MALIIFAFFFGGLIGYLWGNSHTGRLVDYTNELPNGLLKVIATDKVSTTLESVDHKRQRYLVATEVFGGKPIRPKDVVRKIKSDKERKELGISILGYPPLVKDAI